MARYLMILMGMWLAFPAAAHAALLSGRIASVDATFNRMVLLQQDGLGTPVRRELVWGELFGERDKLESAPVGFTITVEATPSFPDNWTVTRVIGAATAPEAIVAEVEAVNRQTGQVRVRDPITGEIETILLTDARRLQTLKPGDSLPIEGVPARVLR